MNSIKNTNRFIIFVFIIQFIVSIILGHIVNFFNMPTYISLILSQIIMFAIPSILYLKFSNEDIMKILSIKPIGIANIILIILISIFIQPTMSFLGAISGLFFTNNVSSLISQTSNEPLWQLLLSIAVVPPILEEIVFRGIVFYGYKTTTLLKASIITGLIFGMAHMDLQQFLYAFIMGIFFCFMVYKTKSIFSSMLSHFIINGTQVILGSIQSKKLLSENITNIIPTFSDKLELLFYTFLIFIFTSPILFLLIRIFIKVNSKLQEIEIVYKLPKIQQEGILNKSFLCVIFLFLLQVLIMPTIYHYILK